MTAKTPGAGGPPDGDLVFYGDPHGAWEPLKASVAGSGPEAVVILGDFELDRPLRHELADLFDGGVGVGYIHGNHDKDSAASWDRVVGDHPDGSLHARAVAIGGMRVAGLGGVFKKRIWLPPAAPIYASREDFVRSLAHHKRWRRGVPLLHRDAIFPEDVLALAKLEADILVCHEAPSTHPAGFAVIDDLARTIRVRLVIHGHHHFSYRATMAGGIRVVGLGKAEVYRMTARDLP